MLVHLLRGGGGGKQIGALPKVEGTVEYTDNQYVWCYVHQFREQWLIKWIDTNMWNSENDNHRAKLYWMETVAQNYQHCMDHYHIWSSSTIRMIWLLDDTQWKCQLVDTESGFKCLIVIKQSIG